MILHQPTLQNTVMFDLAPAGGGAPYRIFLHIPAGSPPAEGWPVLYLLDGNAVIATAVDILRAQAPWPAGTGIGAGVLVAVGYPTDDAYDSVRRSWDLGPPPGRSFPPHRPGGPEVRTGGAEDFLRFLQTELKPVIAAHVATDPARQAVWGHSFGGLFVLHALFQDAGAFTDWISISPSIWWEDCALLAHAARFAARGDGPPARVLLAVGEYEETLAPFQRGAPDAEKRAADHRDHREVTRTREMAALLAGVSGVTSSYHLLPGETHMSVLPQSLNLAVRFAFGRDRH